VMFGNGVGSDNLPSVGQVLISSRIVPVELVVDVMLPQGGWDHPEPGGSAADASVNG